MDFFRIPYCNGTTNTKRPSSTAAAALMEQDLIGRVGEEYCNSNNYSNVVDCTLSLGGGGGSGSGGGGSSSSSSSLKGGMHALFGKGGHATSASSQAGEKRCSKCFRTETPLWRNGPNGAKSLCNACGIRYKKEEKRVQLVLWPVTPQGKIKSHK